jgi:hypothetical protein
VLMMVPIGKSKVSVGRYFADTPCGIQIVRSLCA